MNRVTLQYLMAAVVVVVATLLLRWTRGFPLNHAFFVGLAIGALAFAAWRTVDRMRQG